MNKIKKIMLILAFIVILISYNGVFATSIEPVKFTDEYIEWLQLPEEERNKVLMPRMYEIPKTTSKSKNLLYKTYSLRSALEPTYNLKSVIPENVAVRNQEQTGGCWAFASLAVLETNLAMNNYNRGILPKTYDFSERHMVYATTRTFANNAINEYGFNKDLSGGTLEIATAYLTNGMGAINESEMPFENNENMITIDKIQNKEVVTQVKDMVYFPSYTIDEDTTEIKKKMKEHIYKYGAIAASIHGAKKESDYYNETTGAIYCDNKEECQLDHAVAIIGWNDNYPIENFNSAHRPSKKGAWIIKNSWGTAYGDSGIMYISYEDINIYYDLIGIIKADDSVNYDNIYQYDYLGSIMYLGYNSNEAYSATIFDKKKPINEKEYITSVAINVPQTYTYTVYVNPNGSSVRESDLQKVELKSGYTQTLDAGYHTIEFLNPIEIKSSTFAVVVKTESKTTNFTSINVEANVLDTYYDGAKIEQGKCFITSEANFHRNSWTDLSTYNNVFNLPDGSTSTVKGCDNTIKAFTVSKIVDNSLKNIEIANPPAKTAYYVGDNFDKSGMVVKANYNNGTSNIIIGYDITNGTDLQEGQNSVTISYEGKSVNQSITVEKNSVVSLRIKQPPTKTEYKAGYGFETAGMVIEATYKDGTKEDVTGYTIENGENLKNGQTSVTISFEGKTVEQAITVVANSLLRIRIEKAPDKTEYIVGQDFDKTGMKVIAVYEDGLEKELKDYIIENGENLKIDQTSVTIKFEDKTENQIITVIEKAIVNIEIKSKPSKLTYIMNKDNLDLTGGMINAIYNDGDSEQLSLDDEEITVTGFDNSNKGNITLTVTYKNKTATFTVEIIEEKIENSNFNSAKSDVKSVKAYYFTDKSKQEYILIDVDIKDIARNMDNDSYEYYYYLSTNQKENNITDWVKIVKKQDSNDKINFIIDTKDISNVSEISNADAVFLYIKEVAIKGGSQRAIVSESMLLEANSNIEIYLDNVKQEIKDPVEDNKGDKPSPEKPDNTTSSNRLPNTGVKVTIIISVIVITVIGTFGYIRYKQMKGI